MKTKMSRWIFSFLLLLPLSMGAFSQKADAQVVVKIGPQHHYYHHHHYYEHRHVYYSHGRRYYRYY